MLLAAAAAVAAQWWRQAGALGAAHLRLESTHPGWSFPGRVWSEAVALDQPAERLLDEARARDYRERCPSPGPGELCAATGVVVPRAGETLEPLLLGWLIGPDSELREHLPLEQAPPHLLHAILAAEDRTFWSHRGVRPLSLARAMLANAREGGWAQGGSTLSMQVARAFSGRRERNLLRKLREAVTAAALDRELGKHAILQAYLDAPYLAQRGGLSVCGFQAASRHYFGKDARELGLAEAATLAAILPAPARLAPDRNPALARARRDRVLRAMAELYGYDVRAALAEPLRTVAAAPLVERHPAYLSAVRAWLEERLPLEAIYSRGLQVTAGIDLPAQRRTEELFAEKGPRLAASGQPGAPLQSAAALLDFETGRLRAIWGGLGMKATDFNRATQARRQPGSAFKPLVYALAFGQPPGDDGRPRFTASSLEPNQPRVFHTEQGDWSPRNASDEYSPTASLAEGLIWSRNVATASLLEQLGGARVLLGLAARLGFDAGRLPAEMGLALGQGEVTVLQMAQLAGTLANGGLALSGTPVLRAVDLQGREWAEPPRAGGRVLSPEAAALTRELLVQVLEAGTGGGARRGGPGEPGVSGPAFGKTGTTDGERDVWFVGATPAGAAALWLGYDVPAGLGASASQLAAPLWGWWMRRVGEGAAAAQFAGGVELSHRWICATSGRLAGPSCRALRAPFLPGSEPSARCREEHPERLLEELERGAVPGLPASGVEP